MSTTVVVITAANIHDMKAAINTWRIVIERPSSKIYRKKQNLYLDKGYDFRRLRMVLSRKDTCHYSARGEQSVIRIRDGNHDHAKRRWVVERTNSWHNRFRKLLVRYEKKRKLCSIFRLLYCNLQEDNFGIGSKMIAILITPFLRSCK